MVQVDIDLSGAKAKLSPQSHQHGQYAVANQFLADATPYVPFRDGPLRMSGTIDVDGSAVRWNTPYARAHFYAPGGWNYTTPGTGPRWDLRVKGNHMNDLINAYLKGAGY